MNNIRRKDSNAMQNETTSDKNGDYRVKIFLSSQIENSEGNSDIFKMLRKNVQTLLFETNLFYCYVYETTGASSSNNDDNYLTEIKNSDLVVFVLDSAKEVSRGVLKEWNETKRQERKFMLFFIGDSKENSLIPEIKNHPNQIKWVSLNLLEATESIYQSIVREILFTYKRYCDKRLVTSSEDSKSCSDYLNLSYDADPKNRNNSDFFSSNVNAETGNQMQYELSDNGEPYTNYNFNINFNDYKETYRVLEECFYPRLPNDERSSTFEPTKTCKLDKVIAPLFAYIIGHGELYNINLEAIKIELNIIHNNEVMRSFVSQRIDILCLYYKGESCSIIKQAINNCINYAISKQLPQWVVFDLLIDLRSIDGLTNISNDFEQDTQKRINALSEKYYPLIDRFQTEIDSSIFKSEISKKMESVRALKFGSSSVRGMYELCKIFITAIHYGSLLNTVFMTNRIFRWCYHYMMTYDNREFYIEYVRNKLLSQNDIRDLEKVIRNYRNSSFDSLEAKSLWHSVCQLPNYQFGTIAKLEATKVLWDFFDDSTFEEVSKFVMGQIDDLLSFYKQSDKNEHKKLNRQLIAEKSIEALNAISPRISVKDFVKIFYELINSEHLCLDTILMRDLLFIITYDKIDFDSVSEEDMQKIATALVCFFSNSNGKTLLTINAIMVIYKYVEKRFDINNFDSFINLVKNDLREFYIKYIDETVPKENLISEELDIIEKKLKSSHKGL
jgi:hypothetical protein